MMQISCLQFRPTMAFSNRPYNRQVIPAEIGALPEIACAVFDQCGLIFDKIATASKIIHFRRGRRPKIAKKSRIEKVSLP
jgi:hypothetical protein